MKITDMLVRMTIGRALIFSIALASIYYFLMYDNGGALKGQITQATNHIQELQTKLDEDQKKLDRAAVFKKTAAETGSMINKLLATIPEKFAMPDLMRIVSNEAKTAGSSMSGVTPNGSQVSPVAKEFEELSVSIDLTGSFLQHMVFLSNLTKISQILIVRKLDFTVAREGRYDEPASTNMKAEIVAFRYRGPANALPAEALPPPGSANANPPPPPAPPPTGGPGK
jgi:Tfp pilus assembly protein PilO